jgi:hypothetical protein
MFALSTLLVEGTGFVSGGEAARTQPPFERSRSDEPIQDGSRAAGRWHAAVRVSTEQWKKDAGV